MKVVYDVSFELTVDVDEGVDPDIHAELVDEAVTALLSEEIHGHDDGGTRCGVSFHDAVSFRVRFVAVQEGDDGDRRQADARPVKRGRSPAGPKVREPTRRKRRGQKGPLST